MPDITLKNRIIYEANVGSIICRTPKTSNDEVIDDVLVDRHCMLVSNTDEFIKYFGDPYISPTEYSDAIVALDLVNRNVRMYVSSVDEMRHNDNDGFDIPYNGYTEFYFLDKNKYRTIGYKMKSDMKFCQPIIQSECKLNVLTLYVSLFLLDRSSLKNNISTSECEGFDPSHGNINVLNPERLYKTYTLEFEAETVTDNDIVKAIDDLGISLHILNASHDKSLVEELCSRRSFKVSSDQSKYLIREKGTDGKYHPIPKTDLDYEYDLHTNDYDYGLDDNDIIVSRYQEAINRLRDASPSPLYVCLSKLYRSSTVYSDDNSYIVRSTINDLDPYHYSVIHNMLLNKYNPDGTSIDYETLREVHHDGSHSYLFISTPDLPVSSVNRWLSASDEFSNVVEREDQYNCDMYYGFIVDNAEASTYYRHLSKLMIPAATMAMYNVLLNSDTAYITNAIGGLNIASSSVKIHLAEGSAKKLADNRCNSAVLFDVGYPSIYGDRSLSTLPNLRYSHISRNFVLIRRLISEYLETKKFIINTTYMTDACVNYITVNILDQFKLIGVLSDYSITKLSSRQTVYLTITLGFTQMAGSLTLDFTI